MSDSVERRDDGRPGVDPDAVNTTVILTDRLRLMPAHRDAADDLYRLLKGNEGRRITDNLVWDGPESLSDVVEWGTTSEEATFSDWGHHWSIHDLDGRHSGAPGTAMGAIGIMPSTHLARGDLGYWLGERYWGQGLMSEAAEAVVMHGFAVMGLSKIDAGVYPWNRASSRLLERIGFTREGHIRAAYLKRGTLVDSIVYGLTADEWRGRSTSQ